MNERSVEFFQESRREKWPGRVMSVMCEQDSTVFFALGLEVDGENVSWHDTTRERLMKYRKILSDNDNEFIFEREDDDSKRNFIYRIKPLTLSEYNKMRQLFNFPEVQTEKEMLDYFYSMIDV